MACLLSSGSLFMLGLIAVSEVEELYGLLADLSVKAWDDAVKMDNLRELERY